jgi:hypothetical protein
MNKENIASLSNQELVEFLQDGLISRATGGEFENDSYTYVRKLILEKKIGSKLLPKWIFKNRNLDMFWPFIKNKFGNYAERRAFIWEEFGPLIDHLESNNNLPLDDNIEFNEDFIQELWHKALERKNSDPEGAITTARTLIETILKHVLDEFKIPYSASADLSELYKSVAKELNLAPEQHHEQIFKQILGGANGIIGGLGALRNKLGDAHGKAKNQIKPSERHSELAINMAGSIGVFIYKTYKSKCD